MSTLTFITLPGAYAICRLEASANIPAWIAQSAFYNISKSADELSIICEQRYVPDDIRANRDWKLLRLEGVLDLALPGITARFSTPLAQSGVNLCVIATYDTDYIMIKSEKLLRAQTVLRQAGFAVAE